MEYSCEEMYETFKLCHRRGIISKDMLNCIPDQFYENYCNQILSLRKKRRICKDKYDRKDIDNSISELKINLNKKIYNYIADLHLRSLNFADFIIKRDEIEGKIIYKVDKTFDVLIMFGLLNKDLRRCYKKQAESRNEILRPMISLLGENRNMTILRLDIKSFYEKIPIKKLLIKFKEDALLCEESCNLLDQIKNKVKDFEGLPRGISCSAYLSEIYMKDIDSKIKMIDGIYFYKRYVDDIIIIASPKVCGNAKNLYKIVYDIIKDYNLELHTEDENNSKTKLIDYVDECNFNYLGYNLKVKNGDVVITIAEDKIDLYKEKISAAISSFLYQIHSKNHGNSNPLTVILLKLKMMTSNYKLCGNKSTITTGIYYKYPLLTSDAQLIILDEYLKKELLRIEARKLPERMGKFPENNMISHEDYSAKIRKLCEKYSFINGYRCKKMSHVDSSSFKLYKKSLRYEKTEDK